MEPADILSQIGNTESAQLSSRGSNPGYSSWQMKKMATETKEMPSGIIAKLKCIRNKARDKKDWETSDSIRSILNELGIKEGDSNVGL